MRNASPQLIFRIQNFFLLAIKTYLPWEKYTSLKLKMNRKNGHGISRHHCKPSIITKVINHNKGGIKDGSSVHLTT